MIHLSPHARLTNVKILILKIDKDMRVKVCDFGLSVVKPRGEVLRDKDSIPGNNLFPQDLKISTQVSHVAGTPLWMSPEVLQGKDVDEKSDVYSYGLVLWVFSSDCCSCHHHYKD